MTEENISKLLTNIDSLVSHTYHFQLDISKPEGKSHKGIAINYTDIQERKSDFIRELRNTVCGWVYGKKKYHQLFQKELEKRGYDYQNASSHIDNLAREKFRKGIPQGQFGELLLFNFLQFFFGAPALLRKMPLTTSRGHERFGADAIHFKKQDGQNIIYIGESKTYKSIYKFNTALKDSIDSILNTFSSLQDELLLYTYDDFMDPSLQEVAESYKEGGLANVKHELVCLISYNENNSPSASTEQEIKENIKNIVLDRLTSSPDELTSGIGKPILNRIHYIIFPCWEMDSLLDGFDA